MQPLYKISMFFFHNLFFFHPDYTSNISVPVLYDKEKDTIVSNESAEILRMFNSEFNEFCATEDQKKIDLYPESLRDKIEELNSWIFP